MSTAFAARLREASVVLTDEQLARYELAVDKLAEPSAPTPHDQLTRLRLAFGLAVAPESRQRFDEQLGQAGVALKHQDDQMRRVLAACVLVSRFGRGQGKRKLSSLNADTLAALAARALTWSGVHSTHPDVARWANFWTENVAQDVRTGAQVPPPPTLTLDEPVQDPAAPQELVTQSLARWREQFGEFATEVVAWSTELDPAKIAAQDEQLGLLWWLESKPAKRSAAEAAVAAARQLMSLTKWVPGPPRSDQLLARRLRDYQGDMLAIDAVFSVLDGGPPAEIADLCPLLAREQRITRLELPAIAVAQWLFDELALTRLHAEAAP